MKLFNKDDLELLPYNYYTIKDFKLSKENLERGGGKENEIVPSHMYMTMGHKMNYYYYKPISKYFNTHEFKQK